MRKREREREREREIENERQRKRERERKREIEREREREIEKERPDSKVLVPPKNGKIALVLTTNGLMCSKHVSQKRNEAIDNCQWYKMLLNFKLKFAMTLY